MDGFDRLRRLIGSNRRIADALGITVEHVSRWSTRKVCAPEYLTVVAELLEALPPKDWPDRWRQG